MRGLLLAALLLCPGRLLALGERRREVLLLVPAEDFAQWRSLAGLLASYGDLKLTLALTPDMLASQAGDAWAELTSSGRVELAMRVPGDPILPMIHDHPVAPRPQDGLARIAACRERFRIALSSSNYGFIPGAGAATAALLPAFQAMGLSWVAVGTNTAVQPAQAASPQPPLVLFSAVRSAARLPLAEDIEALARDQAATRLVIDEASGLVPKGSLLALLRDLAKKQPPWRWETVSESLREESTAQTAETDWPGWAAGSWSGSAPQEAAWKAYGAAAADLQRYQNSGTADLKALESATEALYAAQSSRFYRMLGGGAEAAEADQELRRLLMAVYRKAKQTVPGELYASFLGEQARTQAGEVSTDVRAEHGADWLAFHNPAGGASPILSLRVEWAGDRAVFSYRMATLDAAPGSAQASQVVLDTYVDINHVPGAGSCSLLQGREAFAANRDCWEYALSLGPAGGKLFRAAPGSGPAFLAEVPISADAASRTIRASVPRSLLRGNPLRWGYIVAAFAAKPAMALPAPAAPPAVLPGGPLGLLAPIERQKAPLAGPAGARLNAVRLSD